MRLARGFIFMFFGSVVMIGASRLALADASQNQSFTLWHQMQDCAKQAAKQFPDHTPEGNTKRENARQECLRAHRLPVTEPVPTQAPR